MAEQGSTEKKHPDFDFSLRELAGSMGDFGTLFPLALGYIAVNGLDPAGLFILLGLTNIALGLVYRLPMPLQPKKVIAATAIAQAWPPALVYASGFGLGILWLVIALSSLMRRLVRITPACIVRGIQLALAITLGWQALQWMRPEPLLGVIAVMLIILLRGNRWAPASIVIVLIGLAITALRGGMSDRWEVGLTLPALTLPRLDDIWTGMLLAGFAQIPLTLTNAVIAPAGLIRDYFPGREVSERKLLFNMGVMNAIGCLFGGMPVCHGAGGLAGQYYFGARTGGAAVLEGLLEVGAGLFLSAGIAGILAVFPLPLIAGMLLMVGIELGKPALKLKGWEFVLAAGTAALSVITNMGIGFAAGLAAAHLQKALRKNGS